MKTKLIFQTLLGTLPLILISAGTMIASSQQFLPGQQADTDKTLSPYFFVKSDNPNLDQLPLKSTSADVNIAGVIADVSVVQEYANEGKNPIEAIYVFPASTRAAVYSMKMTIGERTIVAKIAEREQARLDYETAKQQGKSASLLEQQRPNVFQMNVANIMPGDHIRVELKYTELLVPEEGVYEFVYPTVVGPRYSNQPAVTAPHREQWVSNPYTHEGEKPTYIFNFRCTLNAGMPVSDVSCSSHKTDIKFGSPSEAVINFYID
jgi:Ca-activated chloride channel family protein